ncbi:hypothetical protein AVEN_224848-1 [Araneus ventricosus]|uniref:Uncharacterized protein n=1 Tax=Araneus ventricosus TaxID=182803 RepID=A0A4Y2WZF8_ARAVE|nr:hypothetical protein AVEN_224848-1 [Araneus ventricosus]
MKSFRVHVMHFKSTAPIQLQNPLQILHHGKSTEGPLKLHQLYFATDLIILNCRQMINTIPEMLPTSSRNLFSTSAGGSLTPICYMATLRWKRVSNQRPSSPKE